jgi:hypothetical protein
VAAPDGLLPEHRIEGDHLVHVDRLQLEFRRHPLDRRLGDVAGVLLDQVQQRQHRTPLHRVVGDHLVDALEGFRFQVHQRRKAWVTTKYAKYTKP